MTACRGCLEPTTGDAWHPRCARALFGHAKPPEIDVDLARFQTLALATVGRSSLSGVQRKLSLSPSKDGRRLQAVIGTSPFILKPETRDWESLPANEHLTMNLARISGLSTPPLGLVDLADGSLAYLVRRFDRPKEGGKLACEDFCQLAELPIKEKYSGSLEQCAKIVARFATEPGLEMLDLFRHALFAWWTGDGDLHRKNLSLLRQPDGTWRLSPTYDRVSTHLVIPGDELSLTVQGKRSNLSRATWLALGAAMKLQPRAVERVLRAQLAATQPALEMIARSWLPAEQQSAHSRWIEERRSILAG